MTEVLLVSEVSLVSEVPLVPLVRTTYKNNCIGDGTIPLGND